MDNTGHDILDRWCNEHGFWRRLFAPQNWASEVQLIESESFTLQRVTTDYLEFSQTRNVQEMTLMHAKASSSDTHLLDYRPNDFRNETVEVALNKRQVPCSSCRGYGQNHCSPVEECWSCNGEGTGACYAEMTCPDCKGNRQITPLFGTPRSCNTCIGQLGIPTGKITCDQCMGSGWWQCRNCGGRGQVICSRCGGSSYEDCLRCDATGQLVLADTVTNEFRHTRASYFQTSKGSIDELENRLDIDIFASLEGDLILNEFQHPDRQNIVLKQLKVEDFDVNLHRFKYGKSEFFATQIRNKNGLLAEFVTAELPVSNKKIAIAIGIGMLIFVSLSLASRLSGSI